MISDTEQFDILSAQLQEIYFAAKSVQISNIRPSDWVEQNIVMPGKPFPGPFKYSRTPYTREIIDCLSPDHPARKIAVMKGAQIGFSSGVIYPGIGWIIKNAPGNTILTVGNINLIPEASEKLDLMIDNAKLREFIRPNVQRKRANKSGDTNVKKEFENGYTMIANANNHKSIRQVDLMYGFFDDIESVRISSKESGNTFDLFEQRFAAYADSCKQFYISTPEIKGQSNIEYAYNQGDKRAYLIPCPCCGEFIKLEWRIEIGEDVAGMFWKLDNHGRVIESSVGYVCQSCAGFFKDNNKQKLLNEGFWKPTAVPLVRAFYSYHISSLYAPVGMFDWRHYVAKYIEANPPGQASIEDKMQTHTNLCLGLPYASERDQPKANSIQKNQRKYEPGTIPERISISDGNGKIVMLTCAVDMNGTEKDGRLDYEIVGWSESGASYSILHGSIGTFVPRENSIPVEKRQDRKKWTYEFNKENSVWPVLEELLSKKYATESGREMPVFYTGLDCGHFTTLAYSYLDTTVNNVVGLKGTGEDAFIKFGIDVPLFKHAREREKLYILQVGLIKDNLSNYMMLNWSVGESVQPPNFMNFPASGNGMYGFSNYFEHYEAEHRVIGKSADGRGVSAKWEKVSSTAQNHMWDCRVYNIVMRDIIVDKFAAAYKEKNLTWKEFASRLASLIK